MLNFLELCSKLHLNGLRFSFDGCNIDVKISQFGVYSAYINLDDLSTTLYRKNDEKGNFEFETIDDFIDWAKRAYDILSCLES